MKKQPPEKTDEEILKELSEFGKKAAEGLFDPNNQPAFDERGVLAGDEELLKKSDAELFPNEPEGYTSEERKQKLSVNNKSKK